MSDDGDRGTAVAVPGWYPDPWTVAQRRYWDGTAWTADVFPDRSVGDQGGLAARQGRRSPFQDREFSDGAAPPPQWAAPERQPDAPPPQLVPLDPAPEPRRPQTALMVALTSGVALAVVVVLLFAFLRAGNDSSAVADPRPTPTVNPSAPASPSPTSPSPSPPSASGSPSGAPGGNGADPQAAALQDLGLRPGDVTGNLTVSTIPDGDSLGTPTLDLCNANFPSESSRTARHQAAAYDTQGNGLLSTEAVLYRSEAAAKAAMAELRRAAATCPKGAVTNEVTGITQKTTFGPVPDVGWPTTEGVTRQAYRFTATDRTGSSADYAAVYLQRGRALVAVYFFDPAGSQPTIAGQNTLQSITNVFEQRLAALPRSVIANP